VFIFLAYARAHHHALLLLEAAWREWYDTVLMPRLGPTRIIGLLFTIVVMFADAG